MATRHFLASAGLLAVGLTGCASQPAPVSPPPLPVASYADMQYGAMPATGTHEIAIAEAGPTFVFPEGVSGFAALALPDRQQQTYLRFRSQREGGAYARMKVLIPRYTFLDRNKVQVQVAVPHPPMSETDFWTGTSYSGQVPIPAEAAFVVVAPAQATREPITVTAPGGTQHVLPLLTAGKIQLELSSLAMATLADSVLPVSQSRAKMFVAKEIDGKRVTNAFGESSTLSHGRGLELTAVTARREVPVRKLKVKLWGMVKGAAPILKIIDTFTGDDPEVEGIVDFEPAEGRQYVINGQLDKGGSSIWIEDVETGQPVTEKVVSQ